MGGAGAARLRARRFAPWGVPRWLGVLRDPRRSSHRV